MAIGMRDPFHPGLLTTIEAARGAAAVAVVMAHAGTILGFPRHLGTIPFHGAFQAGHAGVDFFFVLSGFIIATVHAGDIGRAGALRAYIWKRLVRIYPAYWAATGIALAISALGFCCTVSGESGDLTSIHLLASLILMPRRPELPLAVAWTLEHELLFYLMFAVLILHRRVGLLALASWFGWCVIATIHTPNDGFPWAPADLLTGFLGSSYHLQFAAGIAVAVLVAGNRVPAPRMVAMIGAAGFVLTAAAEVTGAIPGLGQLGRFMYGGSAVLVVGGLAAAECRGQLQAGRLPVMLGTASYSIYLMHVPAMSVLAGGVVTAGVPGWSAMLLLAMGGIASGLMLHWLVERPLLKALRGMAFVSRAGSVAMLKVVRDTRDSHRRPN